MGRPAKPKGATLRTPVKLPEGLSRQQRAIVKEIQEALSKSGILCSLDSTILAEAAFAIDGIRACITEHNNMIQKIADGKAKPEDDRMNDPNFRSKLKKYEETFQNACKELGLSPQARAKIAISGTTGKNDSLKAIKEIIGSAAGK